MRVLLTSRTRGSIWRVQSDSSIGYCAFRKRFNSFYTEKLHPFIDIMVSLMLWAS